MSTDPAVIDHYAVDGLLTAIEAGLVASGSSRASATVETLGPADEFHIGGRPATIELCEQLGLTPDTSLLDIGCGIGGTARFCAVTFGARVTGLDLTPDFVEVARELNSWVSLEDRITIEVGSALDTPFDDECFDAAIQLHVGMNIEDKDALFAEVHRVLRPGGHLAVYDIMRSSDGDIDFPVPWSSTAATSFVATADHYRQSIERAGLAIVAERNRGDFARQFFEASATRGASSGGPPPLGVHIVMGEAAPLKISNMAAAVMKGVLAPVEIICEKAGP